MSGVVNSSTGLMRPCRLRKPQNTLGDNEGVSKRSTHDETFTGCSITNLAKSRAARDGNKLKRKNFRPRHIEVNHPVLMRNHTAKAIRSKKY